MQWETFSIKGLFLLKPKIFGDQRGFFMETYNRQTLESVGIDHHFVQDNLSRSSRGTLRGLHFQVNYPQAKLVSVLEGQVFDVAVDCRPNSPTYGQWQGVVLSAENRHQFFVPEGFAHGFLVLSETALFAYKCSDFYHPEDEGGVIWDDPDLAISWPLKERPLLSQKDRNLPRFAELERHPNYPGSSQGEA